MKLVHILGVNIKLGNWETARIENRCTKSKLII